MKVLFLNKDRSDLINIDNLVKTYTQGIEWYVTNDTNCFQKIIKTVAINIIAICVMNHDAKIQNYIKLLQNIKQRTPIVILTHKRNLSLFSNYKIHAIIPVSVGASSIISIFKSVASGMCCFPEGFLCLKKNSDEKQNLSARQIEILKLTAEGKSNKTIGRILNISTGTVKSHLETIFNRLNVKNRHQASRVYLDGLQPLQDDV